MATPPDAPCPKCGSDVWIADYDVDGAIGCLMCGYRHYGQTVEDPDAELLRDKLLEGRSRRPLPQRPPHYRWMI